jgi:hypothetical protein
MTQRGVDTQSFLIFGLAVRTYWAVGWADIFVDLEKLAKRNITAPAGNRTVIRRVVQPVRTTTTQLFG